MFWSFVFPPREARTLQPDLATKVKVLCCHHRGEGVTSQGWGVTFPQGVTSWLVIRGAVSASKGADYSDAGDSKRNKDKP